MTDAKHCCKSRKCENGVRLQRSFYTDLSQDPRSHDGRNTYPDKHSDSLEGVSGTVETGMREYDRCVTCGLCVGLM